MFPMKDTVVLSLRISLKAHAESYVVVCETRKSQSVVGLFLVKNNETICDDKELKFSTKYLPPRIQTFRLEKREKMGKA